MSSGKPTTPVSSPKIPKAVKLNAPSTPPCSSKNKQKRLSSSFLKTPEQNLDSLPFSPSLKRTNSGNYKSPDYKLNSHNVTSPYTSSNLLQTPRHTGYDSDDNNNNEYSRSKLQKTPQYFSPARKLFHDNGSTGTSNNKEDLSEISLQLKNKLSSALGKLQQKEKPSKINFTELSFDSNNSPTKKLKNNNPHWTPSTSIQKANLNLQTLQQSPLPKTNSNSPILLQSSQFIQSSSQSPSIQSPIITSVENFHDRIIKIPSPDEESSAHNALMATLSRQRRKSRSSFSNTSKPISSITNDHQLSQPIQSRSPLKLPPINVDSNQNSEKKPNGKSSSNNEQDAVISLMSLSSPQAVNFNHSRTHSLNSGTPASSRSSSVIAPSTNPSQSQKVLPPISGIINTTNNIETDNDETDIDDDVTDDDMDNK